MIKQEQLDQEFIDFLQSMGSSYGLDALSAKVFAILYLEPEELSMEDLVERTGYSLASVCNTMKVLERTGMLRTEHKPKTRKIYYHMTKDFSEHARAMLELVRKKKIDPAKNALPALMEKYEAIGTQSSKLRLAVIRKYYEHVLKFDRAITYALKEFEQS
ncbi:MAG: hypothetical protein HGA85_00555 [Nanoarchaeota archaeon]|nr:hypothetical protein [Nanoarchaeota archaeon]